MQNFLFVTQNALSRKLSGFSAWLVLAAALAVLAGCGSGQAIPSVPASPAGTTSGTGTTGGTGATGGLGGTSATGFVQTITGTAATGAPLVGATVTVQDINGKTNSGTTAANGTFSIPVTGGTPPFMLVAVPKSGTNLYSVLAAMDMTTTNTQNVNITIITSLVMYELNGGQDPASMYKTLSFSTLNASAVATKENVVRSKIPTNTMNPVFNTMTGSFVAAIGGNDPYDKALDALGTITAYASSGVTLAGLSTPYPSTSSGTGGTSVSTPSITLKMTDPGTGKPVTSISTSSNALVTATVYNASGAVVPNAIVTFTTDPVYGAFSGGANTALTDANGLASATLTTSNTSGGAAQVTAAATVVGAAVTGSLSFAVGASTLSLSAISLPAGTLSAYGTASVSVDVLNNGIPFTSPLTVRFTSACTGSGKAALTASVTTVNGKAAASYLDNGCNNASPGDTITATLSNGATVTGILPVGAPALGSIQYVSTVTNPATTPPVITLKGTGGLNRSETAKVTFKVVDSAGNPVGNTLVNFSLNTCLGGLILSGATTTCSPNVTVASATSDPTTGYVVTNVISGTISTAVRVTATTATSAPLATQSDQLVISTGIPAQDSFSTSATIHNMEGWNYDGVTSTITVRAADHFHNPVPDGTAVSFTSEGGSVVASCNSVAGSCQTVVTSQALRPDNGRVTVLARATGEEAFTDRNGNGTMNDASEAVDANNRSTDMPEAFVDWNENGVWDLGEPYFDFNGNGSYDGPDGKYNGVLCTPGAAICSTQKSIDVRSSQIIVFSSSNAVITINGGASIDTNKCDLVKGNVPSSFTVTVIDVNGNAMPAGTTVAFSTDNGVISSGADYVVPDTIACRSSFAGCPASAGSPTFGDRTITIKSDAQYTPADPIAGTPATCKDATPSGTFTVTVTTPGVTSGSTTFGGIKTVATAGVTER